MEKSVNTNNKKWVQFCETGWFGNVVVFVLSWRSVWMFCYVRI